MKKRPELGILICEPASPPFAEDRFFRRLAQVADEKGMQVVVFSPLHCNVQTMLVKGYAYAAVNRNWVRGIYPLPRLLYDRCFYLSSHHYREYKPWIKRLQAEPRVRFLGLGLYGKWEVYHILRQHSELQPILPFTQPFTNIEQVRSVVANGQSLILKPQGGSRGAGILRIGSSGTHYFAMGRDRRNRKVVRFFANLAQLLSFCSTRLGKRYLLQPYLHLHTPEGHPFDIRALVQKNGAGAWEITGMAVRQGKKDGLTANLHGGGRARLLEPFLQRYFPEQSQQIYAEMHRICLQVPPLLEASHGPLVELGLDMGIEPNGKVWLIEANSKPGRSLFPRCKDRHAARNSIVRIVEYAQYLLEKGVRG